MQPKTKKQAKNNTINHLLSLEQQHSANYYQPLDIYIERGRGVWVWDSDGNRYLDCLAAYSSVNLGHSHPKIIKAMVKQARKLSMISRAFRNQNFALLTQELCELSGYQMMLPMNSGGEAVESAIKVVRKWAHETRGIPMDKAEIIVCDNNFHGRSITMISMSSNALYRSSFGPFTPGFVNIPFGKSQALEQAINKNTAAFLVEPIQGEAGIIMPPSGYLAAVREICTRKQILLLSDEVQTGLGRTGRWFAAEHDNVKADLNIIGKSLSGGLYPISAVLGSHDVLSLLKPGEHGNTFAGNPLASAIARSTLQVLQEEGIIEQAEQMGGYMMEQLGQLSSPAIRDIRGKGLMIGIEVHPEAGSARNFCEKLSQHGLLCKETHEQVIRITPPLVINRDQIDMIVTALDSVLPA